ncbi:MAG: two pore domain potassium channel family protein [Acidobacteria bacterium]|nr:two pore domain potassium channel family protein [Acidobacteriota bacterium]
MGDSTTTQRVESTVYRRRVRTENKKGASTRVGRSKSSKPAAARPAAAFDDRLIDALVLHRSIGGLLGIWVAMVAGFGVVYWAADLAGTPWLDSDLGGPGSLADLANAIYFSFVTALTIGYGDISPLGPARVLAIIEGATGLLIFGLVISKLVSRRQEELLEDIHRIAFEQRLGRVRTSLHLVLSELQTIVTMCGDESVPGPRLRTRTESTVAIFEGELRTVHDLLYRPHQMVDEQSLESILASLAASLEVLNELLECLPREGRESSVFVNSLRHIHLRAVGICSDCVPHEYAPDLAAWMDRVQTLAEKLG